METIKIDVAVVGAGVAGIHLCQLLSSQGLRTILIDRQAPGLQGAQWVNGIPWYMLKYAGVKLNPSEIHTHGEDFLAISPGQHRVLIPHPQLADVDMRALGARLLAELRHQKLASFKENTQIVGCNFSTERLSSIDCLHRITGKKWSIQADLFVDASGLAAVLRSQTPVSHHYWLPSSRDNLGVAAQEVRQLVNVDSARRYLAQHQARPGQAVSFLGLHGGFSVVRAQISSDWSHLSLLTCARAGQGQPSGQQLIKRFAEAHDFVGPKLFGGSRAIPLGRPFSTLVSPGLALLGDSAQQVYASHASGIGIGLIAAAELAKTILSTSGDIGSLASLWRYNETFHRGWGGMLGVSDLMRRALENLDHQTIDWLFSSGISDQEMMGSALGQLPTRLKLDTLPSKVSQLMRRREGRKLAKRLLNIPLVEICAKFYPSFGKNIDANLAHYHRTMSKLIN